MAFKISGFAAEQHEEKAEQKQPVSMAAIPKKSVVQVYFPGSGRKLAYYNDQFDLHCGDLVYVDGAMEGQRGRVVEVSYNFKIKLSDYQRVIAVIDTDVHGRFFMAGSHFIAFDPATLPAAKTRLWFLPPAKEDDDIISSNDDSFFSLEDLSGMNVTKAIAEHGYDYYTENRVRYLSINGIHGYAIVEGSKRYEVEFEYQDGMIRNLLCDCPCTYHCKHEFSTMLQLKETLGMIAKHYAEQYEQSRYFAAVNKATLFSFAIDGKETGNFTL